MIVNAAAVFMREQRKRIVHVRFTHEMEEQRL